MEWEAVRTWAPSSLQPACVSLHLKYAAIEATAQQLPGSATYDCAHIPIISTLGP